MNCTRCGEALSQTAAFCRMCGTRVAPIAAATSQSLTGLSSVPPPNQCASPVLGPAFQATTPSSLTRVLDAQTHVGRAVKESPVVAIAAKPRPPDLPNSEVSTITANRPRSRFAVRLASFAIIGIVVMGGLGYWGWTQMRLAESATRQLVQKQAEEKLRLEAEARNRAEAEAAQQAAAARALKEQEERATANAAPVPTVPVAPSATPAELVAKCDTVLVCADLMLSSANPKNSEVIRLAADKIAAFPKPAQGDRKTARELNRRGLEELGKGNADAATGLLQQALTADSRDVEIQSNLGLALLKANRPQDAWNALMGAILLDPRRTSAWAPLALVGDLLQKPNVAEAALLLAYEFSANREKTTDYFKTQIAATDRASMKDVYSHVLAAVQAGY
jgi:tetratricopeptide (TPR) repeat protein